MAKNITLMGASYSNVPAVQLPQTGGGTARFDDASVTTAVASDVTSGKVFLAADGTITTGTNSGGGGASNFVTGTFTGTTKNASMTIKLSYTGNGQAIAFMIYPSEGTYNSSGTFYSAIQRYAVQMFCAVRGVLPFSSSSTTSGAVICQYKNSASSATSYSRTGSSSEPVFGGTASASATRAAKCVHGSDGTYLYAFIAGTSYGFMANIEYTYHVIFSE